MNIWGEIFAASYDYFMAASEKAGLQKRRQTLLRSVAGRVLEIGGGTGANLPFYGGQVARLIIVEPDEAMSRQLHRKLRRYPFSVRMVRAIAEQLPFPDETFDHVVSTLVLCSVAEPDRALAEIRRVLKPGGRLLFMEHVRSDDPKLARWQDRLRRPWSWLGRGCQCNRPTAENVRAAGLSLLDLRREKLPKAPPIVRPLAIGEAQKSGAASRSS